MTREEIKAYIPHRDGMLLLDEATVLSDGTAVGIYHVTGEEFFLQGHFPGNPVVPGVMLCEIMAQTCSVLLKQDSAVTTPYFTGIRNVTFKRTVHPGDTVHFTCEITRKTGHFYFAKGEGTVGGEVCVRGEFSFALLTHA